MKDVFYFKRFSVCQRQSAMKVGTDGVLLGTWAHGGKRILDIGTGTGIIALMMSQRFPDAFVTGVEIDHDAAEEASKNVSASPFAARIDIQEIALQAFIPTQKYDAIVSNPPFFPHGFHTNDDGRRKARQTEALSFSDILVFAREWLDEAGELSVILPTDVAEEFSSEAFINGFFLSRKYLVKTVVRKKPKRCLISFSKTRPRSFENKVVTMIDDNDERSDWYKDITDEFYIL